MTTKKVTLTILISIALVGCFATYNASLRSVEFYEHQSKKLDKQLELFKFLNMNVVYECGAESNKLCNSK